jgi:anti-anti-sigma factor
LERAVETALDGKAELIIDLRELRFLDSQGLDSLLRASRQAKEHAVVLRLVPGPRTVNGSSI